MTLARKRIGGQADPAWPVFAIQALPVEGMYRGQVKRNKEALGILLGDDDISPLQRSAAPSL